MEPTDRRRVRTRAIGFATAGLLFALAVGLGLRLAGLSEMSFGALGVALVVTLAVQGLVWLLARRGWDTALAWDPHYVLLPMLALTAILGTYVWLGPDNRHRVFMTWFVAVFFIAGRGGFREVVLLAALMAAVYVGALAASGALPESALVDEMVLAGVFVLINCYAGLVFERLRHERRQMRTLRLRFAELARTDALTGIANRRGFEEALLAEVHRVSRYGGRFAVAMIDVDHFKNYNDRLGHPQGDALLRQLADIVRGGLRTGDVAARYGGEEFAVVLINTGAREGAEVVERLRVAIEQAAFPHREVQPGGRLTVSAGVAEFPGDAATDEGLVIAADSALYRAKAAGRNRVLQAARAPLG